MRNLLVVSLTAFAAFGLTACGEVNESLGRETARICDIVNTGRESYSMTINGGRTRLHKGATPPDVKVGQIYTYDLYAGDIYFGVANYAGMANTRPATSDEAQYIPNC